MDLEIAGWVVFSSTAGLHDGCQHMQIVKFYSTADPIAELHSPPIAISIWVYRKIALCGHIRTVYFSPPRRMSARARKRGPP
jgi:hypothetical protein